jgi:hypothetical protein
VSEREIAHRRPEPAREPHPVDHGHGRPDRVGSLTDWSGVVRRDVGNRGLSDLHEPGADDVEPLVGPVLRASGAPLDGATRTMFEARLRHGLGDVRVHTDAQAAASASAVGAAAYTVGQHVVFADGQFDVGSESGRQVLAHELVHTIQQGGPPVEGPMRVSDPGDVHEQEAARLASSPVGHAGPDLSARAIVTGRPAGVVARQPPQAPAPQHPLGPPVPLVEADRPRVAPAARDAIEKAVVGYIPLAFTAFSNATAAHAAAIKNEAKAKAELLAAIVDVVTGFLAPVFANWVAGRLMAKATDTVTKSAVVALISKQDVFKAAFTGATKIANQVMKSNANALFGETEIDAFALGLRNTFQRGAASILDSVTTLTDEQLIAVWLAYDPENADETAYRKVLGTLFNAYQTQVEPIGQHVTIGAPSEGGFGSSESVDSGLYEVQLARGSRLATLAVWSGGQTYLTAWVTSDMAAIARAKATALGLGAKPIALKDVQLSLVDILVPPPVHLRGKDSLEVAQALGPAGRAAAAADPDVETVVEHARNPNGRVPNEYERRKTLWVLRGYSSHALVCLDELNSWFPNGSVIDEQLRAADPAERARLAADPWFVDRVKAELNSFPRDTVLHTLGLGPAPVPIALPPFSPGYPYDF